MFERLVTQVLHGYLGRYVKDFHKHQLKITIWNATFQFTRGLILCYLSLNLIFVVENFAMVEFAEEVFLENVELSLEAFDYLQLPFALKQGGIGKISIKIPWKKLGWEPFVISLENVFLCASQRDDEEWSLDEVEKREFAGKKAKLAAAELAKLSKRVCENQAGFISIITAKIVDSIQVSIRDFHILYHDKLSGSVCNIFGLKFSSLRTMKQNPSWSVAKGRGAQVNKTVEIMGLEFYCGTHDGPVELMNMNNSRDSTVWQDTRYDEKRYNNSILSPCDVSMSLLVFGSAGVIGNPMGFARSLGLGIRDFLSVPARSIFQSPTGLITGMAQGTTSLLSNTVYAISDAATQFSKAAHKGIVAFTFDDQAVSEVQQQQTGITSHSKGVINEVFEGLTGLLQSPINGAEKHGLPGVLSGIALGITGLVAKPAASILEVTGKTAQSIRNRSRIYQTRQQRFRVRLPRPLSQEYPLRPYCWEEAVGASVLVEADGSLRLKDEIFVTCKKLKEAGKFVIITERLVLIVSCSSLVDLGKPEFRGVPSDLEWVIESEIHLESVIHADCDQGVVHIVGSSSNTPLRQNQLAKRSSGTRAVRWNNPTVPLIQTNVEIEHKDAENLLQVLSSTIELGKDQGWGCRNILHRSNIK